MSTTESPQDRSAMPSLWPALVIAAVAAFGVAFIGGSLTEIGPWYAALKKPAWQPPDWLFGPAWTLIFALAAMSAAFGWRSAPNSVSRQWMVALFLVNGLLNVTWSALFFFIKRPDWALVEVALLWGSILMLIVMLWRWSKPASLLLVPYLAWVTFASILNQEIVRLNAPF